MFSIEKSKNKKIDIAANNVTVAKKNIINKTETKKIDSKKRKDREEFIAIKNSKIKTFLNFM